MSTGERAFLWGLSQSRARRLLCAWAMSTFFTLEWALNICMFQWDSSREQLGRGQWQSLCGAEECGCGVGAPLVAAQPGTGEPQPLASGYTPHTYLLSLLLAP